MRAEPPDVRACARQAFRETAAVLQPALARDPPAPDLLERIVEALVSLACAEASRTLALCPLESLSAKEVVYVRRFRLLAREMLRFALARASRSGLLRRCESSLLARALVSDADFLGRALAHVEGPRARDAAAYVFGERLRSYVPGGMPAVHHPAIAYTCPVPGSRQ